MSATDRGTRARRALVIVLDGIFAVFFAAIDK